MNPTFQYYNLKNSYCEELFRMMSEIVALNARINATLNYMKTLNSLPFTYQILQNNLLYHRVQADLLRIRWLNLIQSMNNLNNSYIKSYPDSQALFQNYDKDLLEATPNSFVLQEEKKDNAPQVQQSNPTQTATDTQNQSKIPEADVLRVAISLRYNELQRTFEQYKTEKDPNKKLDLAKKIEEHKSNISIMRTRLSLQMRSYLDTGKITQKQFEAFKVERARAKKKYSILYRQIGMEFLKNQPTQQIHNNPVKQVKAENVEQVETEKAEPAMQAEVKPTPVYGVQPQRMKISQTAEKLVARVNEHIPKAKEANHNQNVLEAEMKKIDSSMGTHNDEYQKRAAQKQDEAKIQQKETRKSGIKRNVSPELLRQRDKLAAEINQMKTLYGTANNEEYQMRVSQLRDLDKKIFGHKATRIYRDLNKPIQLIGGDFVELPKDFVNMRINPTEKKSR